jgi:hypothetical protein
MCSRSIMLNEQQINNVRMINTKYFSENLGTKAVIKTLTALYLLNHRSIPHGGKM